jgi:hypothetical protein
MRRVLPRQRARADAAQAIDFGVFLFTALAVVMALTISPSLLTNWKIQYVTAGGGFYEKLHPATYCVVLALCLSLLRNANPVRELVRIFASSWAIPFYLFCSSVPLPASSRPFCCRPWSRWRFGRPLHGVDDGSSGCCTCSFSSTS